MPKKFEPIIIGGLQINQPDEEEPIPVEELSVDELQGRFSKALRNARTRGNDKVLVYKLNALDDESEHQFLKICKLSEIVEPGVTTQRFAAIGANLQPFIIELRSNVRIPKNTVITVKETPAQSWAEVGTTAEAALKLIQGFLNDPWDELHWTTTFVDGVVR